MRPKTRGKCGILRSPSLILPETMASLMALLDTPAVALPFGSV